MNLLNTPLVQKYRLLFYNQQFKGIRKFLYIVINITFTPYKPNLTQPWKTMNKAEARKFI